MQRVIVNADVIIINSQDGKSQTFVPVDEESTVYQAIKTETNNFTENMDFPLTETEQRIADLELAIASILGGA